MRLRLKSRGGCTDFAESVDFSLACATLSASTITHNQALGGEAGAGGSDGHGVGGGVDNLGTFTDLASVVKKNKASTSNDDVLP